MPCPISMRQCTYFHYGILCQMPGTHSIQASYRPVVFRLKMVRWGCFVKLAASSVLRVNVMSSQFLWARLDGHYTATYVQLDKWSHPKVVAYSAVGSADKPVLTA